MNDPTEARCKTRTRLPQLLASEHLAAFAHLEVSSGLRTFCVPSHEGRNGL